MEVPSRRPPLHHAVGLLVAALAGNDEPITDGVRTIGRQPSGIEILQAPATIWRPC
jgi:hypothetical protein